MFEWIQKIWRKSHTPPYIKVLGVLADKGSDGEWAYDIVKTLRLGVATVYLTLSTCQDRGWVDRRWHEPVFTDEGPRRVRYYITLAGEQELARYRAVYGHDE